MADFTPKSVAGISQNHSGCLRVAFCTSFRAQAVPYSVPWEAAPNCGYWIEVRNAVPKRRLRKSRSSSVDELAAVIAYGVVLNQLSWNWRECWQPAGSHASHWVARVGQARRCEASAWMSRRPSSWSKLSTIVERPGQPVALIPRKRGISCVRASVLPSLAQKNRDTSLIPRYLIAHGG